MKKFATSIALAAMIIGFNGLSAQEKLSEDNPDIIRYTKALELNETQQKQLKEIYAETEMKLKENKETTLKLKQERTAEEKPVTQDEKSAWSKEMDSASKERRMLIEERNKRMLDILDEEQLLKYKEWKEKRGVEEPAEKMEEAPVKEQVIKKQ